MMAGDLHAIVSRGVLLPLARGYRLARPSLRPAMFAFLHGLRFRRHASGWTAEQKRDWILRRLRTVAAHAARESAYYRDLFARVGFDPYGEFGFDEFAQLPVLDRADVNAAGRAMIATSIAADQLRRDSTGGSTGVPTEVWLGPEERGWRESGIDFVMTRVGAPPGATIALLWGHHLDPHATDDWRSRYHAFEQNVRWLECFRLSPETLDRYHHALTRWNPTAILAYASALASLAERLLERGLRPAYPRSCLVTGAEKLLPAHRELIERAFGRPVHERYGSRDVGAIAVQSDPARSHDFEVDWSNVLIEPETNIDGHRESPILVTKLHADGMPMLRYRLGDIARFPADSRPGYPALRLHEIVGRHNERIWLPDGRWLDSSQLPHLLKDYPVREFSLLQGEDYSVELQIVPKPGFDDTARCSILAAMGANMEGLEMRLVAVEEIPRTRANKWRPVVSAVRRERVS
jgi:phenylacetate-coenzyme A ligase PaaK-like adenylate-forming protein